MMKKKIMVVDDDLDQIHTIKLILGDFIDMYEVTGADSGMQCLQLLKNNYIPDLILLDIMMPKMSGWEVFKRLKENPSWKNIPVVFFTARTDGVAENAGRFLGDDYIEKPYTREELKNRIDKVLKNTV